MSASAEGRIFFSNTQRNLIDEDVVELLSVGVDIGSSTSHLVFSLVTLERLDSRYVVVGREVTQQSAILLTPYRDDVTLDAAALGRFIDDAFDEAAYRRDAIDTGALILTGVAARRRNARAIGELFAGQAGKFVAVSAGDALEAVMAAYGSGAIARSIREQATVMNVDIGGGTSKIAVCQDGEVVDLTAIDVGARLVVTDGRGTIVRLEQAGRRFLEACGLDLGLGDRLREADRAKLAAQMADHLFEAISAPEPSPATARLLRLSPLATREPVEAVTCSGGVSEFIYGEMDADFGDLGGPLAGEIRRRIADWGPRLERPAATIRATVIGAAQYTVQISGSTIFLSSDDVVPVRNVAAIAPALDLGRDAVDPASVAGAIRAALGRMDLGDGRQPVAVCVRWSGSATFQRLHGLCRGLVDGLNKVLRNGHPLILVADRDVGGLLGLHCREELELANPVISIDGIDLKEFDYVDIGALLEQTGAVPVVIKSLVFPTDTDFVAEAAS
jgi:ethanolamine utilization protein EutA